MPRGSSTSTLRRASASTVSKLILGSTRCISIYRTLSRLLGIVASASTALFHYSHVLHRPWLFQLLWLHVSVIFHQHLLLHDSNSAGWVLSIAESPPPSPPMIFFFKRFLPSRPMRSLSRKQPEIGRDGGDIDAGLGGGVINVKIHLLNCTWIQVHGKNDDCTIPSFEYGSRAHLFKQVVCCKVYNVEN